MKVTDPCHRHLIKLTKTQMDVLITHNTRTSQNISYEVICRIWSRIAERRDSRSDHNTPTASPKPVTKLLGSLIYATILHCYSFLGCIDLKIPFINSKYGTSTPKHRKTFWRSSARLSNDSVLFLFEGFYIKVLSSLLNYLLVFASALVAKNCT